MHVSPRSVLARIDGSPSHVFRLASFASRCATCCLTAVLTMRGLLRNFAPTPYILSLILAQDLSFRCSVPFRLEIVADGESTTYAEHENGDKEARVL